MAVDHPERLKNGGKPRNTKWLLLIVYVLLAVYAIYDRQQLLAWIKGGGGDHFVLAVLVVMLLALIPVVPYGVIGAAVGLAHGFLLGSAINWLGAWLAALVMFLLVRYLFAEQGRRRMERYEGLSRLNRLVEANAFLAILFARVIPIFPAPLVNTYSALVRVPFRTYLVASAIGKVPIMVTLALIGDQLFTSWRNVLLVVVVYALFLGAVYLAYRFWSGRIWQQDTSKENRS